MPESIISASGAQYGVAVDEHNRMFVVGSIVYMPQIVISGAIDINNIAGSIMIGSVSAQVDSVYVQSGDNINITGMPKTEVYGSGTFVIGSENWIKNFGILGSDRTISNRVAGSIVNMPSVTISSPETIGSFTGLYTGSKFYQGDRFGVSGNVTIENPQVNILLGSTSVYNRVAGSIVDIPNITINNPSTIGSYTTQTVEGTVTANTGLYAGSKVYQGDRFGISGIVDANVTNSSIQVLLGSTSVYNRVAGSVVNLPDVVITNPQTIGSWTGYVGSIWSMPSVTTGSEQWIQNFGVLGSNRVVTNLYAGSKAWIIDTIPTNADRNNEAYKFEYDAQNNLGSIVEFIGIGSYVSVFTWTGYSGTNIGIGSRVTKIGSYF